MIDFHRLLSLMQRLLRNKPEFKNQVTYVMSEYRKRKESQGITFLPFAHVLTLRKKLQSILGFKM